MNLKQLNEGFERRYKVNESQELDEKVPNGGLSHRDKSKLKEIYREVVADVLDGANADLVNNINEIFSTYGGKGYAKAESPTFITINGYLPQKDGRKYTFYNSISLKDLYADVNRFAEDFTMAYYRCFLNGAGFNTMSLMKALETR